VTGLKNRALLVLCSNFEVPAELSHIRSALNNNGYSRRDLSQLVPRRTAPSRRDSRMKRVTLPYIPGLSHKVDRCFRKAGLEVAHRPPPTLRSILCKKKPCDIKTHGFVYRIPCSSCSWSYVGETGRTIGERINEHKRAVRQWSVSSEVATHVSETGHGINWEMAENLSHEPFHFRRIFKESWFSKVHGSGNRVFHDLDVAWNGLLPLT